jgi:single-strand DNA-binding protein
MASFNRVILMGNLTRDPEIRRTQGDMAICKIGLAVNRRFKDGQTGEWREEPTFVDVTIFGKRGEAFAQHHTKGGSALIEGHLRLDTWQDKETGGNRSKLYVVADNWEFVGGRGGGGGGGGGGGDGYAPASVGAETSAATGAQGGGENLEVDDTPF